MRSLVALIAIVALFFAGLPSQAAAMVHGTAAMADCPHGMAAAGLHPGAVPAKGHPALPAPPPCCFALPAAAEFGGTTLAQPEFADASRPHPVSQRLPTGSAPGPELPPPRA